MNLITPVILSGGNGTRLWPRSRKAKPKPFLPLLGETSLFEETLLRCTASGQFADPVIVAGAAHQAHVEAQLGERDQALLVFEPAARNTAAAIALAAGLLDPEAVMLVCPSDHHIADCDAFRTAAAAAADLARQGWLVSFGIAPTAPETGYGYILRGQPLPGGWQVARFVEKPTLETAKTFLADGNYSWNGGIFAFRVRDYLAELEAHAPKIAAAAAAAVAQGTRDGRHFHPDAAAFAQAPDISVDYAVMEKTERKAMVPVDMGWTDIGNWQALHAARPSDETGNTMLGTVELIGCRNVHVDTDGPRVSVIGLENVIVVVDGDEVLVTSADGAQLVGKLSGAANQ